MTTPRISFLDLAQTLAAYLAAPAVLVYPFGFLALFVQFSNYFGLEAYTAWYAVSLVNKVIVLGQGFTILFVVLLGSALLAGFISQILLWWRKNTAGNPSERRVVAVVVLLGGSVIALVLYVLYSRMLSAGRVAWLSVVGLHSCEGRDEALRHQLNFWPDSMVPALVFVVGGWLGGLLTYRLYPTPFSQKLFSVASIRFFGKGIMQRWILPGLTVAYLCGIVASLVLAWFTPGFLPYVNFGFVDAVPDKQPAAEEQPFYAVEPKKQPTSDRYLSYSDGHWHILHRGETREGEREYRIISLRETEISYARVVPLRVLNPRAAPFPWDEPSTQDLERCESHS
jgi:hypothetical protein